MLESSAAKLAKANRFDPNALASNQRGQLTSNQTRQFALRLVSMVLSIIVSIVFGIAGIVLAVVIVPKEAFLDNWMSLFMAMISVLVGLIWILDGSKHFLQNAIPLLRDILRGQVMLEEGLVSRDYDDNSYISLWHRLLTWILHSFAEDHAKHIKWLSGTHYYVLGGQQFTVSQKGYGALPETSFCRLYYAANSRRLVNIELALDRQTAEEPIDKATRSHPHLPGSLA